MKFRLESLKSDLSNLSAWGGEFRNSVAVPFVR